MDDYFPWDETPETDVFPTLDGLFNVSNMEASYSKSSGKRMFKVSFCCVEPKLYKGLYHTEYYVVGTDDEPDKINADTRGMRGIQQLRIACNVGKEVRSVPQFISFMSNTNPPVGLRIIHRIDEEGEPRNSVAMGGYWKPGTREPMILTNDAGRGKPKSKKQPPKPVQQQQTYQAPPKPSSPPKPVKNENDEGPADIPSDVGDDIQTKEAEPAEGNPGFKITCQGCGEQVAPNEYAAHLASCKGKK